MKFSVLLPTRNRLDLLKYAIESVRRQDYDDWEIVVSDNCSEDDIAGYVQTLHDPRIRYYRTQDFIPVTDNWNNALRKSSGEYVIMLGDDDCLMQGYFTAMRRMIETYQYPDFVYTSAFLYAYPGVIPGHAEGFLRSYGYADFLSDADTPFWLGKERAFELVQQSMKFKVRFGYNMQFALVSREIISKLQLNGDFFQSPYPDYYAMNALFLVGERILIFPKPIVTIGISPKSFGYYYFNEQEKGGTDFLNNLPDKKVAERIQHIILPGTNMNTSWLLAMETLLLHFGAQYDLSLHYRNYRFLQAFHMMRRTVLRETASRSDLKQLLHALSLYEIVLFGALLAPLAILSWPLPRRLQQQLMQVLLSCIGTYPRFTSRRIPGTFLNIIDVYENVKPLDVH